MTRVSAKQKILLAAQEQMTTRGYSATSVDDIIRAAGVAKGSFYHAFKSKEELAMAALEDYERRGWEVIAEGPYTAVQDPVQRVLAFLDFLEAVGPQLWQHGCMVGSVAIEVYTTYPKLIDRIDQLFDQFENGIAGIFAPALEARQVTAITAKSLSVHLLAVIEGSIITARSHQENRYLADGLRHFKHYVTLLLAA